MKPSYYARSICGLTSLGAKKPILVRAWIKPIGTDTYPRKGSMRSRSIAPPAMRTPYSNQVCMMAPVELSTITSGHRDRRARTRYSVRTCFPKLGSLVFVLFQQWALAFLTQAAKIMLYCQTTHPALPDLNNSSIAMQMNYQQGQFS
jgi:hypothetical protein